MGTKAVTLPTHKQILQSFVVSAEAANHLVSFGQIAKRLKIKVPSAFTNATTALRREIARMQKLVGGNEPMWNQVYEGNRTTTATKPTKTKAAGSSRAAGS
jgi:hypothetical protein